MIIYIGRCTDSHLHKGTLVADSHLPKSKQRRRHLTPDRFVLALLAVECLLWLSERFRWFPVSEHKGWTVLIALATLGAAAVLMLLWCAASLVLRRRFQFSIRSLCVLMLIAAIISSWFAAKLRQAERQRVAVEQVLKVGADVGANRLRVLTNLELLWFCGSPVSSECKRNLQKALPDCDVNG